MVQRRAALFGVLFVSGIFAGASARAEPQSGSDDAIRQQIIQASLANYSGRCPCPYNTMRNGRACGGRSAYSRPGGASPLCYPKDVTDAMVQEYRAKH